MDHTQSVQSMIGTSASMQNLFDLIKIVSQSSSNVFIRGESGTGKELVAKDLHASSLRNTKPFVAINCSAIPDHLLESELFGHVKGSFTGAISDKKGLFEEADGGTLFLDEIGDLDLSLQAKLLRVLQNKEVRPVGGIHSKHVDTRIISATHQDLKSLVKKGKFRDDLFYRLNVIPIHVPPLRRRKEDIPLLVNYFIHQYCQKNETPEIRISEEEMKRLLSYHWPGNVRELENVVERLIVLRSHETLEHSILEDSVSEPVDNLESELIEDRPTLEKLEERYIKAVLREVHNQKTKAAHVLGISRRTLYRKELLYGLT